MIFRCKYLHFNEKCIIFAVDFEIWYSVLP